VKGWQIFIHSVRQVFGNFEAALRVSGLLYLLQAALSVIFDLSILQDEAAMRAEIMAGTFNWAAVLLVLVVSVVTSLWIAVGWHRYVLLVEQAGLLPPFRGELMLKYFGKSLAVGVIVLVIASVAGFVAGMLYPPLAPMVTMLVALMIGNRLSVILPGSAVGKPTSLSEGWAATSGDNGTFLALSVIMLVVFSVIQLPAVYILNSVPLLAFIWSLGTGWLFLMISISIITTLYGHYIEKRALV